MEVIVFEKEAYYKMLDEIKKSVAEGIKMGQTSLPSPVNKNDEWVDGEEAQRILNCKKDKLRSIREKPNAIIFSQDGRPYSYNKQSLYAYKERHIKN